MFKRHLFNFPCLRHDLLVPRSAFEGESPPCSDEVNVFAATCNYHPGRDIFSLFCARPVVGEGFAEGMQGLAEGMKVSH